MGLVDPLLFHQLSQDSNVAAALTAKALAAAANNNALTSGKENDLSASLTGLQGFLEGFENRLSGQHPTMLGVLVLPISHEGQWSVAVVSGLNGAQGVAPHLVMFDPVDGVASEAAATSDTSKGTRRMSAHSRRALVHGLVVSTLQRLQPTRGHTLQTMKMQVHTHTAQAEDATPATGGGGASTGKTATSEAIAASASGPRVLLFLKSYLPEVSQVGKLTIQLPFSQLLQVNPDRNLLSSMCLLAGSCRCCSSELLLFQSQCFQ